MRISLLMGVLILFFSAETVYAQKKNKGEEEKKEKSNLEKAVSSLKFRSLGPAWCSGRIGDFAFNPENPSEYYVGVASGNLWKTQNNGITWKPIFENYGTYSIGVVEMDPNNTNVIWVGTGENNHQRALGYGDGVYKSIDGGESFKNMGLKDSRQIGGIVIDPRNSDVVLVACEGSVWGLGGDRGLYKSKDGGENWNKVLEISENTGVNNIVMDPSNPDILYATTEQRRRHHYGKINGGPESSVYKSTDGGENWREIKKGLPTVHLGGMGIAVSPVDPNVVYLIIEAAEGKGGFYRSLNKGESWERMSGHHSSGQYYNEITCDPVDVDKVYSVETFTHYTEDAGKTWKRLGNNNKHVDDHAIWINPKNTDHIIIGSDGGIYETFDHGANWDFKENLPVTQFYRLAVDNAEPFYNVYGGTQDNNSTGGPSQNTSSKGVTSDEWIVTLGGDGFWQAIDPEDPNIVYSEYQYGNMYRYNKTTGEKVNIKPRERKGEESYKWNWNTPLFISPNDSKTLYAAANKVFKSTDRGNTWEVISEDLTAQKNRDELKIMDKYWSIDAVKKHVSTSLWGTLVALDESRIKAGLIYAGSDDGVISITEDDGANWRQVKAKDLGVPEYTYISDIQADKFDENVVYVTFDNRKMDDFKPYIFKSSDKGKTWKSISSVLPINQTVHTIQQDHKDADLLFVGTEFGVFTSLDGGENWTQLKSGVPTIAVRDLALQERENDLVLATFGRGFYVLDDYSPLRILSQNLIEENEAHIFPIKDAKMFVQTSSRNNQGSTYYFAENPEYGAHIRYYLKEAPKSSKVQRQEKEKKLFKNGEFIPQPSWRDVELEKLEEGAHLIFTIRDAEGNAVRTLTKKASKGMGEIVWDLRLPSPRPIITDKFNPAAESKAGWPAMPGKYSVSMQLWNNDSLTDLVAPVSFLVEKLFEDDLTAAERKELADFDQKVTNMVRVSSALNSSIKESQKKVASMLQTMYNMEEIPTKEVAKAREIAKQVEELRFKMEGVKAKASGEEVPPTQVSINNRVSAVAYARFASTGQATNTEKVGYEIAKEELQSVMDELTNLIEDDISTIESKLEGMGANWTPGSVPKW
ncbi:WD40/YVTN/BNR-like repeat-containing protein [Brumimicrobium oceani]|uniref:Glycosyl hydrolase n=1 Tax=Brumimicrobium oceani TaxID=2100725 RepID=A0A2U2XH62_9FLAO|nr:glycosyl hydrolase [Brumimicrobium oceani]PWH87134.1 glycosyl hydrolase [Brumimicrobium oceani]